MKGLFLLARIITSQLRVEPVDTSPSGWEATLSRSVESAFNGDIERIPPLRRNYTDLLDTARARRPASYGAGLPHDVWVMIATAEPDLTAKRR